MKLPFSFLNKMMKPVFPVRRRENILDRIPRIIIAIFLVIIYFSAYYFLATSEEDWNRYTYPDLSEGDISTTRIIAPFDIKLPKPPAVLEKERRIAARTILPVFSYDRSAFDDIDSRVDSLFANVDSLNSEALSDSVKTQIRRRILKFSSSEEIGPFVKIVGSSGSNVNEQIKNAIKNSFLNISEMMIVTGKDYLEDLSRDAFVLDYGDTVKVDMVIELDEASDLIRMFLRKELLDIMAPRNIDLIYNVSLNYLKPNLFYDSELTNEARIEAINSVRDYQEYYRKGERIVDANVPITAKQVELLKILKTYTELKPSGSRHLAFFITALGKTLITSGFIGIVAGFLFFFRRKIYNSSSKLILLMIISFIPISAALLSAYGIGYSEYLIPVAITSILVTIIFDAEVGILTTFGVVFIAISFFDENGLRLGMIYFLSGCIGVFTVGRVRHRKQFYKAMFLIPVTTVFAILATNNWSGDILAADIGYNVMLGALNGFLCPIIAIGLLPIFETLFNVTTDITLLELSDLNNPLLKELAVKAPGTFSSVLQVGMLAEASAERIGANPLLCRVGAYYHDIGKVANSFYFIENQMGGENPHDKLSPQMSALVIASHVKEGYELGLKNGLPEPVLDILRQHHGTSLMDSIYHKALEEADGKPVEESMFRYPGPKPQTREAGVVMLVDLVEAASRSLKDRSPNRLKVMINTIIQKRFMEGELDECELTLKDLHNIEETCLPILIGSYHGRIEYPWQKEKKENTNTQKHNIIKEKTD